MPVQVRDPFTGQIAERLVTTEVQIDEELLEQVAERTGGEFFRATDPESLRQIFERIDELEKSEIEHQAFRRYRDLYPPVLLAAAALLLGAALVWAAGLRVVPV
jgi:Ca-activated chloride channel family protein